MSITVNQRDGRWEVVRNGQTMSLHYTGNEARAAAETLRQREAAGQLTERDTDPHRAAREAQAKAHLRGKARYQKLKARAAERRERENY